MSPAELKEGIAELFLFQVLELALICLKGEELKQGGRLMNRQIIAKIVPAFSSVPKQDAAEGTHGN